MMSAPEKIWVQDGTGYEGNDILIAQDGSELWHKACADEYHIAREGQPCSTDEFISRLSRFIEKSAQNDLALILVQRRMKDWVSGDFAAAMEGLE